MPNAPKSHQTKIRESRLGDVAAYQEHKRDAEVRGTSRERGYSANWDKVSKNQRARNPLCVDCGGMAECVDHIKPKAQGGTDHPSNLQSMCWSCHSKKTAKEDGGFGRRYPRKKGVRQASPPEEGRSAGVTPKVGGGGASAGASNTVPSGVRCASARGIRGGAD